MGRSWHLEWIPEILYAGSTNHHHLTWKWKNHHNTIQRSGLFKRLSLMTGRATPPFCLMGLFSKWPGQKCCVIQILGCANPSKEQLLNGSVQTYNHSPTHKKPFFESLKSLLSPTNHICNEVGDSMWFGHSLPKRVEQQKNLNRLGVSHLHGGHLRIDMHGCLSLDDMKPVFGSCWAGG